MKLQRFTDWPERLAVYVEQQRLQPFVWARQDCVTFAAGAIEAVTGHRLWGDAIPDYGDRRGAVRYLRRIGGLHAGVCAQLGEPVPPLLARVGDIGLLPRGALVVCNGDTWLGPAADQVRAVPLFDAIAAWRVG